jgi:pimeloyl-ACP methyl ester carboxylesterase
MTRPRTVRSVRGWLRITASMLLLSALWGVCHAQTGKPEPFRIAVPQATLDDLEARLRHTRFPDQIPGSGWDYGTDTQYLKELVAYWADRYDWRAEERRLNAFHQYRVEIDGIRIHYIHERGKGPHPIPLLMMHGWPSSFVQFEHIIPLLTDPAAHGAPDAPSFDVVVVSLPGFGFSDRPTRRGFAIRDISERMTRLMTEVLGYSSFGVRGSDIGGSVAQQMALAHPEMLIGLHVSGLLRGVPLQGQGPPSEAEQKFTRELAAWSSTELAYATLHSQKPQTLAPALNDSPAGLASWIVEKFRRWGDTHGDLESRFSKDELLKNIMVYWVTETIGSSIRTYYEFGREQRLQGRVQVPTAVLMARNDQVPVPREVSERLYNVVRWNETPVGGHFLEWEEPERVAADLRDFFAARSPP